MNATKTRTNTRTVMPPKQTLLQARLNTIAEANKRHETTIISLKAQAKPTAGPTRSHSPASKPANPAHECNMTLHCHGNARSERKCAQFPTAPTTSRPVPTPKRVDASAHFERHGTHSGARAVAFRWGF